MTPPAPARCAPAAEERGDDLAGSAAPVPRWLLIEQPGPWGRDAVLESRLDRSVAQRLTASARAAGVRVMLIRRPARPRTPPDEQVGNDPAVNDPAGNGPAENDPAGNAVSRRWAVVDSRPGREATWWGDFSTDAELLDVPFDGSRGEPSSARTYLVCTHGRHDACCAMRGRPVAAALAALDPDATWECSHTGGDRFAANLVVLPHGFAFGHVTPAVVPGLVAGLDALAPERVQDLGDGTWSVRLRGPAGPVDVLLRSVLTDAIPRITCAAVRPQRARIFELVDLRW